MKQKPLVFVDEIQKIPQIMDTIQLAIDKKLANFILTGSSLRKLRRKKKDVNLLPGRVIELHLGGLTLLELGEDLCPSLEDLLLNGALPENYSTKMMFRVKNSSLPLMLIFIWKKKSGRSSCSKSS